MLLVAENPLIVGDCLQKELEDNRIILVQEATGLLGLQFSPFGVILKRSSHGKWRLIMNLSLPKNASVDDGISKDLGSLSYVTVDEVLTKSEHWAEVH